MVDGVQSIIRLERQPITASQPSPPPKKRGEERRLHVSEQIPNQLKLPAPSHGTENRGLDRCTLKSSTACVFVLYSHEYSNPPSFLPFVRMLYCI